MADQATETISFALGIKMLWTKTVKKAVEGIEKQSFGFVLCLLVSIGLTFTIVFMYKANSKANAENKIEMASVRHELKQASQNTINIVLQNQATSNEVIHEFTNVLRRQNEINESLLNELRRR